MLVTNAEVDIEIFAESILDRYCTRRFSNCDGTFYSSLQVLRRCLYVGRFYRMSNSKANVGIRVWQGNLYVFLRFSVRITSVSDDARFLRGVYDNARSSAGSYSKLVIDRDWCLRNRQTSECTPEYWFAEASITGVALLRPGSSARQRSIDLSTPVKLTKVWNAETSG